MGVLVSQIKKRNQINLKETTEKSSHKCHEVSVTEGDDLTNGLISIISWKKIFHIKGALYFKDLVTY